MKQILNSQFFFHRRHKITRLHVSDSGKGRWRWDARRSYSDICKSFIVTDTMHTTPCGTQRRDTLGTITNCYKKHSVFTSLYQYLLSQIMSLWTYSVLLVIKYRYSLSNEASRSIIHIYPFFSFQ